MNITSIVQSFSVQNSHGGNSLPQDKKTSSADTPEHIGKSPKQVDLRNVSINEINELIKTGKTELLDVVPFIPPHVLEQYNLNSEDIGNIHVDLLGQVEKNIDFRKSIGESVTFLEKLLEDFKSIDGAYLTKKIDITA